MKVRLITAVVIAALAVSAGCAPATNEQHEATPTASSAPILVEPRTESKTPSLVIESDPEPSDPPKLAPEVLNALPVSTLDSITTAPQATAALDDVQGVATPRSEGRIAGYDSPNGAALLALDSLTLEQPAAWTVVAEDGAWVQVLVPMGRGALASQDSAAVNSRAVWVLADQVDVAPVEATITIDRTARTAIVRYADGGERVIGVSVGKDSTPTPAGLGMISAHVSTDYGIAAATSFQSSAIDVFQGDPPLIALHLDPQQGASIGHARSNGCIRIGTQADLDTVLALPFGTPVYIK